MKIRTLALFAALIPAFAQAAPAQATKQQCLGYLKDGLQITIHASTCEPAAAQDERYSELNLNQDKATSRRQYR